MKPKQVNVNDLMQTGFVYLLAEPAGRNFHHDFHPELTPKEMLKLGVFGGKYMTDCVDEFPATVVGLARDGLDCGRRSARVVPVVLPLLHGTALP